MLDTAQHDEVVAMPQHTSAPGCSVTCPAPASGRNGYGRNGSVGGAGHEHRLRFRFGHQRSRLHLGFSAKIPEYNSETGKGIQDLKIGLPKNYFLEGSDKGVSINTLNAFRLSEKLGARCKEINIPNIETANDLNMLLISTEAALAHQKVALERHRDFNQQTLMRILSGVFTSPNEYEKLKRYRIHFIKEVIYKVFDGIDMFIAPVWPCYLPNIKDSDAGASKEAASLVRRIGHNTRPINYLGLPAICLPTGFDPNGLPMSIQLVGKPFSEDLLLRAALSLEKEYNFWFKKPNI